MSENKQRRRQLNIVASGVLLYLIVGMIATGIGSLFLGLLPAEGGSRFWNFLRDDSLEDILSVFVGLFVLHLWEKRHSMQKQDNCAGEQCTRENNVRGAHRMGTVNFIMLFSVMILSRTVSSLLGPQLEGLAESMGFCIRSLSVDVAAAVETGTGNFKVSVLRFLYVSFLAPIAEELVYRGYTMRQLNGRFGKRYAIVLSALIFGLMHGNMDQILFTFPVGLVLGYTAMEYSVRWSMALHILNNFMMTQIPVLMMALFGQQAEGVITAVLLGFYMLGIVTLVWKRKSIWNYFGKEQGQKGTVHITGTSAMLWVLFLYLIMLVVLVDIRPLG